MDNLEISWVFELAINLGRFEDLKTLIADMVEGTPSPSVMSSRHLVRPSLNHANFGQQALRETRCCSAAQR